MPMRVDFHVTARSKWLAGLMLALCFIVIEPAPADAEARSLKLRFLHTGEAAEIVYKRNGRYVPSGLEKINYILRDWRRNEPTRMDPKLLDLVWEAYRSSGATGYIQVVSGYRAPATNAMLRRRSNGVARESQHMLGKALDFYIPGVPLKKLRDIGLKMQGGGVGYYPTSGSPFVHMDVGNVRHWPGISRLELARVFPNGKTLHLPSDGKPLPGYQQALASYNSRKAKGEPAIALASAGGGRGLLARLFGGGADEEEDNAEASEPKAASVAPKLSKTAKAAPPKSLQGIAIVAPEDANRADIPVADGPKEEPPETIVATLPTREIPLPGFAPRTNADVGGKKLGAVPFDTADSDAVSGQAQASVADVPLPTWRPNPVIPVKFTPSNQGAAQLAADQHAPALDGLPVLATARPDRQAYTAPGEAEARRDEIKAVIDRISTDEYKVAALASARLTSNDPFGAKVPPSAEVVVANTVKTTPKEARPSPADAKPQAKAVVVAAAPKDARWALNSRESVAMVRDATRAPRHPDNFVHLPPNEVYTAGFQMNDQMADPSRFTGNAVEFLPIARFSAK